jgi:hypothetical protein
MPLPYTGHFQHELFHPVRHTIPAGIDSITLYKDPLLISGWGLHEQIPATSTVYIKVTGTDGATQTRDIATVSLNLSWGPPAYNVILNETASNSGGYYLGSFDFSSIPLYGFPNPLPPVSAGSMTFTVQQDNSKAATLTVSFPELVPAQSTVNTLSGTIAASGATAARIDTSLILGFNSQLENSGSISAVSISSGAVNIPASRLLAADRKKLTITPDALLPFSSLITVNGVYTAAGLKSPEGNPLYRAFNFSFTTQASQTPPLTVDQVSIFPDASYSVLNAYSSNQDFPASGTIFIEARASDVSPITADYTMISLTTGASVKLTETAVNSGVYRGSYTYPMQTDGFVLTAASSATPAASQTLRLSIPVLTPLSPASAAVNVAAGSRVEIKASEPLDPATVNAFTVKLFQGATEIAGTVVYRVAEREIEFTPTAPLAFSTTYTCKVGAIKDLAGNQQAANLGYSFTTQATSISPTTIVSLKVFADNSYAPAVELADLAMAEGASQVYIEVIANDLSAATADSTTIQMLSNLSALTSTATLLETGVNTGIFRGSLTLYPEENAELTIRSQTDTSVFSRLRTYQHPRVISLVPASGTSNLYLDTIFSVNSNKDIDAATVSTSSLLLSDSHGLASYSVYLHAAREIRIISELYPGAGVNLKIPGALKDTDGLAFSGTTASYSALTPTFTQFRLYSDALYTSMLASGSQVEAGQTIHARLNGSNSYFYRTEKATATILTDSTSGESVLNENTPGIFSGSFIVPDAGGEIMRIIPQSNTALETNLEILPVFSLLSFSPASGAAAVAADSWPTWNFSRAVEPSDVTAANFRLMRVSDSAVMPGILTLSPTGRQVRFQPSTMLNLLTQYEMSVSQLVEDTAGHPLGVDIKTRFTTQPPPLPPADLASLKNYENGDFATSTAAVSTNGILHLELVAADTSFSTYDTARVRIDSSDGSIDGLELTLVEIAPPSGIFRYSLPISLPAGTTIRIRSQAAPAYFIDINVSTRTQLTGLIPASGSSQLYLDSPISLTFSQAVKRSSAASGIRLLASDSRMIPLDYSFSNADRTVQIRPGTAAASSTRHILAITTDLRDINDLFLLPQNAWYTTRSEQQAGISFYTGIGNRQWQDISVTGEAVAGNLSIVATTTDMFADYAEYRHVQFTTATQSFIATLGETGPGFFSGSFVLSASMPANITGTLKFGNQPSASFVIATVPQLLEISPASGSFGVAELPTIIATFSRKMAFDSAAAAISLQAASGGAVTASPLPPVFDSTIIAWKADAPLPQQASCTLMLNGINDYLGQSLAAYQHNFSTGGRQGINLYRDNGFAQLIATSQLDIPLVHVEVSASGSSNLTGRSFFLQARTGTRASQTVSLQLQPISQQSGRFRCSLEFEAARNTPQHLLPLMPGEWLELTSPQLTDDRRIFYYRHSGSVAPAQVEAIRFYSEKHFAQRLSDSIGNPTLYIEAVAEDQNWLTRDKTRVKVYSESDRTGFFIDLIENGTHSSLFHGQVRLDKTASDGINQILKVLAGQQIYVESAVDPAIRAAIKYLPENGLRFVSVFPSPARGNHASFRFYLNFPGDVDLEIFDSGGDEVFTTVIRGQEGENVFKWSLPRRLANGVYFYQMKFADDTPHPKGKRKARGKFAVLR